MKRSAAILIPTFALLVLVAFSQQARSVIDHRLRRGLDRLSLTACGSRVVEIPWLSGPHRQYAQLLYYRDANIALAQSSDHPRVIFFGDSLTFLWGKYVPSLFLPEKHYLNRGIGGQTTGQMIWRFRQDVIDLHPDAVIILAGTNDIAFDSNLDVDTENDFKIMVEMAKRNNIHVILCSVPPLSVADPLLRSHFDARVAKLNGWLRSYAAQQHLPFVDYYSALTDSSGRMGPPLTSDGIHPDLAGYAIMRPLAQQAIDSLPTP